MALLKTIRKIPFPLMVQPINHSCLCEFIQVHKSKALLFDPTIPSAVPGNRLNSLTCSCAKPLLSRPSSVGPCSVSAAEGSAECPSYPGTLSVSATCYWLARHIPEYWICTRTIHSSFFVLNRTVAGLSPKVRCASEVSLRKDTSTNNKTYKPTSSCYCVITSQQCL